MPTGTGDTEGLKWLTIDNFTPGMWSQPTGGAVTGVGPGPLGAAQDSGATYSCYATPTGALAPLAGLVAQFTPPATVNQIYMVGFFVISPISSGTDQFVYGMQKVVSNTVYFYLWATQGGNSNLLYQLTATPAGAPPPYTGLTGGFTAVNPTVPTVIGNPCLALAWNDGIDGVHYLQWLWPNPSNPSSNLVYTFAEPLRGQCHVHQSRILMFEEQNWDFGTISSNLQVFPNNDALSYTDPPNSLSTFITGGTPQESIFVQENPAGIGAYGSFSAGELMLIKRFGGGVIISGDLNYPTVTYVPGVQPTFNASTIPSQTQMGLVYRSTHAGVWAWSGNSTSQKLSTSLDDFTFEDLPGLPPAGGTGLFFQAFEWGQFIVTSGDLVYDTVTNAWWRLAPTLPGPTSHIWFGASSNGALYAAPGYIDTAVYPYFCDQYSFSNPASVYSWQSVPLPASIDKTILVRRVALRAQGVGSVEVTVSSSGGGSPQSQTLDFTNAAHPTIQSATFGVESTDIVVTLLATATTEGNAAPTIFSCSLGYEGDIHFTNPM